MRHGMWEKVAKRSHKPAQLFSFGAGSDDIMLYGTVGYELKDGKSTTVEWAARAHFVEEGGVLKMDFYQVYLVRNNCFVPYVHVSDRIAGLRCYGSSEVEESGVRLFVLILLLTSIRERLNFSFFSRVLSGPTARNFHGVVQYYDKSRCTA